MSKFRPLQKPAEGGMGWYIPTTEDAESFGWLTTTGIITASTDVMDILFFDSEFAAHNAAILYYGEHGKIYNGGETVDTNESRVMEFE